MVVLTRKFLRQIADAAYGYGCGVSDDYSRGYAAALEDIARHLGGDNHDPFTTDRLNAVIAGQLADH